MEKIENSKVYVEVVYNDGTKSSFDVISHAENASSYNAEIMMITRGVLQASSAVRATAYNLEGIPFVYIQK